MNGKPQGLILEVHRYDEVFLVLCIRIPQIRFNLLWPPENIFSLLRELILLDYNGWLCEHTQMDRILVYKIDFS